jgi:hypothetical protein
LTDLPFNQCYLVKKGKRARGQEGKKAGGQEGIATFCRRARKRACSSHSHAKTHAPPQLCVLASSLEISKCGIVHAPDQCLLKSVISAFKTGLRISNFHLQLFLAYALCLIRAYSLTRCQVCFLPIGPIEPLTAKVSGFSSQIFTS